MKKIYFIFTHTGTILSRIIKTYTGKKYSHVSISLDKDLKNMYSFGRVHPYNPILGGFIKEDVNKGTFRRFKNTKAEIYSFKIEDEQYENLKELVKDFISRRDNLKFNVFGIFLAAFNKKIDRENYFYCAEFIKYLLEQSDIEYKLPEVVKPMDIRNNKSLKLVYKGKLNVYK